MDSSEIMDFGGILSEEKADFVPKGLVDIFLPLLMAHQFCLPVNGAFFPPGKGRKGKKISKTFVKMISV